MLKFLSEQDGDKGSSCLMVQIAPASLEVQTYFKSKCVKDWNLKLRRLEKVWNMQNEEWDNKRWIKWLRSG